jgi:hypothetical protein
MKKDISVKTIDLDNLLNEDVAKQPEQLTESVSEPVQEKPNMDWDAIIAEWFYRLPKGYAEQPYSDSELRVLDQVVYEYNNGGFKPVINEASPKRRVTAKKKTIASKATTSKPHPIFNKEYLDGIYPKHSKAIMDAYRAHGKDSSNLNKFGKATSLDTLMNVIGNNTSDPLFKALFGISSVSGKEGEAAETSGRGGLGKGEVLCVLLTKGGMSGGTAGTDLDSTDGSVRAEVKAGESSTFKVPMAAARITKFQSQSELRKLYALVESVKDTDEWPKFLNNIQKELGSDAMELDGGVYFGKKPTPSNINQTEYSNIRKFFKGCNSYFFKSKDKADDSLYIDIDNPSGEDALLQAKLKTPKTIAAIKPNSNVELNVVTKDVDAIRVFKMFEYRLKKHPFVAKANEFDKTAMRDLRTLLSNKYIIFHEKPKGVLPKPILIEDIGAPYNAQIVAYTLDQVVIKFSK